MISSNAFDYMNVLNKAASASWEREQLISNNIANMFHWMTRWQISIWTI